MPSHSLTRQGDGGWFAGATRAGLPLACLGQPLEGYAARRGTCTAVHDPPTCTALAIMHGSVRLVIVTIDVIAVDAALTAEVASRSGLSRGELLLAASHTHSGPAGVSPACCPSGLSVEPRVRSGVVRRCASLAREALARMEPATLAWGRSEAVGVASHRNEPQAPVDERVSVLVARRLDGTALAVVAHFACHPTVLGADNLAMSADLGGALRAGMGTRLGTTIPILFVNGAAADVSTRFTRRGQDFIELDRLGRRLAAAAERAVASARPLVGELRTAVADVELPVKLVGPVPELERLVNHLRGEAAEAVRGGAATPQARMAVTRAEGAARQLQLAVRRPNVDHLRLRAFMLGDLGVLAFPGEVASGIALAAERTSPFPETVVFGYSDDYAGYLVGAEAHAAGTYEALASPFAPEAADVCEAAATSLLGQAYR